MTKRLASKCNECNKFCPESEECAIGHNLRFYSKDGYKRVCNDFDLVDTKPKKESLWIWFKGLVRV